MTDKSKTVQRITDRLAGKATARGHDRLTIWERESPGFVLRVTKNGVKSYAVTRRIRGGVAPVRITLPQTGLGAARAEARRLIELMRKGVDPRPMLAGEREAAKARAEKLAADTFAARWAMYDAKHIATLKERTQAEYRRPWRKLFEPKLGARPLAEIRRGELQAILDGIKEPIAANRVYATMRHFFRWCVKRGYLDVDPCPAERPNEENEARARVLDDDEIKALWTAELEPPYGQFLRLLLLTGQRRGEVAGMRWSELRDLDGDAPSWRLPAERTKTGREHVLPLSPQAVAVIQSCDRHAGCDFALTRGGKTAIGDFSGIKAAIDEASGVADWRVHDLRRTVATGLEKLGVAYPVRAAVLNHSKGATEGVTAIYSRHDYAAEMRHALTAWAAHVEALTTPPQPNVLTLRRPAPAGRR